MNKPYSWRIALRALLLSLAGLLAANILCGQLYPNEYYLDIGTRSDVSSLDNVLGWETDSAGTSYRWTSGASTIRFESVLALPTAVVTLKLGDLPAGATAPRQTEVQLDGQTLLVLPVEAVGRHYSFLLPATALNDGSASLTLRSPVSQVLPDPREVGVRLDDVWLRWAPVGLLVPVWQHLLLQLGIVLVGVALAWRLGVAPRAWGAVAGVLIVLLAILIWHNPFIALMWQQRLLGAAVLTLLLIWNIMALPPLLLPADLSAIERHWLGLVTLGAVGIRLVGVLYPLFASHDLYIHSERLFDVQLGTLRLFDRPAEFNERIAVVPPAFYLLVAPFSLVTLDPAVTIQGFYAVLDGLSALLVALFVRQIGASPRAALLAAIAIACLPIQFTALWWGFAPQVVGQWLVLLTLVLVQARVQHGWFHYAAAGLVFCIALLMHNGVAVLGGCWLTVYLGLAWWRQRRADTQWRQWALVLFVSGVVATLLLYADVAQLYLRQLESSAPVPPTIDESLRVALIGRGLEASLRPLGLLFTLAGLALLLRYAQGRARWIASAWLVSTGLFFAVDVLWGMQVRYAYFAIPLVCAGLALLLDQLMQRRIWGGAASWGVIGLICIAGLNLWFAGVIVGIKPTLMALTH